MSKFPSLSSKQLVKMLENGGALFVRQGRTDHAIYSRTVDGRRYSAPVQMGKKSLDPVYCKLVFKQLKFTNDEINELL
ncbi:MAG: type II toxin-antitoxin system HicA family toxin [bacterium]|nr:type II toxin-antitoxin system HicA family toxin [bacterium]